MKPDLITITTPDDSTTYALIEPKELAALWAIVEELAKSTTLAKDDCCCFCDMTWYEGIIQPHEPDCLVMRAKEAMQ